MIAACSRSIGSDIPDHPVWIRKLGLSSTMHVLDRQSLRLPNGITGRSVLARTRYPVITCGSRVYRSRSSPFSPYLLSLLSNPWLSRRLSNGLLGFRRARIPAGQPTRPASDPLVPTDAACGRSWVARPARLHPLPRVCLCNCMSPNQKSGLFGVMIKNAHVFKPQQYCNGQLAAAVCRVAASGRGITRRW
jgi:hypothetical protein